MARNADDIMKLIRDVARLYTPEWKPGQEGDLGTEFAMAFARLQAETEALYEKALANRKGEFWNALETEKEAALPAREIAVFFLPHTAPGTSLAGRDITLTGQQGEQYAVVEPVSVCNTRIVAAYNSFGKKDYLSPAMGENGFLPFFSMVENNLQEHRFTVEFPVFRHLSERTKIRLSLGGEGLQEILAEASARGDLKWRVTSCGETAEENSLFLVDCVKNQGAWLEMELSADLEASGDVADEGEVCGGISIWAKRIEGMENLVYGCLQCFLEKERIVPEVMVCAGEEATAGPFHPFSRDPVEQDCFYIASREAFSKPDALVTLSFCVEEDRWETENPLDEMPVKWKWIMKEDAFREAERCEIIIRQTVAEYWNGKDFVRLQAEWQGVEDPFHLPKTGKRTQSITFRCPEDMKTFQFAGRDSRWLRFRVTRMENGFRRPAVYRVPQISQVLLRYTFQEPVSATAVEKRNNLQKQRVLLSGRTGSGHIPGNVFDPLPEAGQDVYLGLDKSFGKGPLGLFFHMESWNSFWGLAVFSVWVKGRWKKCQVKDTTINFSRSGVVILRSEEDAQRRSLFGRELFWIRISREGNRSGAPEAADCPAVVKKICVNGTEVMLLSGSPSDGKKLSLGKRAGYITGAWLPLAGEHENQQDQCGKTGKEAPDLLNLRGRIVTKRDVEKLAGEAEKNLLRAVCFTDLNRYGRKEGGAITLVCVSAQLEKSQPAWIMKLAGKVREALERKGAPMPDLAGNAAVIEPFWIKLTVKAELLVDDSLHSGMGSTWEQWAAERLNEFLHPQTGNYHRKGYQFGEIPDEDLIYSFLASLNGAKQVRWIALEACRFLAGREIEVDLAQEKKRPEMKFTLAVSGEHQIRGEAI